ncbi:MAG: amino-acid N-acetyltransferase [Spirochaetaceae bacterium]
MNNGMYDLDTIREALRYARRYRGSTFVLKIDYPVVVDDLFPILLQDIALLHQSGIRIVIVPGARQRIDEMLRMYGISQPVQDGERITTGEALPFVEMASFDVASKLISGLAGKGINSLIGNWVRAKGRGIINGVDFQLTGRVERVDSDPLIHILGEGYIPIIPPVGWNASGKSYNLSADEVAHKVAVSIPSEKLFYIGTHGVLRLEEKKLPEAVKTVSDGRVSRLTVQEARELEKAEVLPDIWSRLVSYGRRSCEAGVNRVHILDGSVEGVVLREIFSNLGIGTMIHTNIFESVRPMERSDISEVLHIMEPYVRQGVLVFRDTDSIESSLRDYVVYDVDGTVHGCAALHQYKSGYGEIAAIAVDRHFAGMGIGSRLVGYLFQRAREIGLKRVFAFTTQTSDWFERLGFREGHLSDIPEQKRAHYNRRRNSKILIRDL